MFVYQISQLLGTKGLQCFKFCSPCMEYKKPSSINHSPQWVILEQILNLWSMRFIQSQNVSSHVIWHEECFFLKKNKTVASRWQCLQWQQREKCSSYFILQLLHTLCHNINPALIQVHESYLLQSRILELKEPQ